MKIITVYSASRVGGKTLLSILHATPSSFCNLEQLITLWKQTEFDPDSDIWIQILNTAQSIARELKRRHKKGGILRSKDLVLILDEFYYTCISVIMVLDEMLRIFHNSDRAFGGVIVIGSGDGTQVFYPTIYSRYMSVLTALIQFPPVSPMFLSRAVRFLLQRFFEKQGGSLRLTKQYRQVC